MYLVPAENPEVVNWYKSKFTEDPILDTAATLAAKQRRILTDPKMHSAKKVSLIREIL